MLGTVAVRRYVDTLAARGCAPRLALQGSGVEYSRLENPDFRIGAEQYRSIVGRLMVLSGEDGFGLASSTFRDLGDLGAVGHASAASRTVRDTYRVWTRFGPTLLGMRGQLVIRDEDAATVTFGVANPDPADPLYRFSVEELLTMVGKVGRTPDGAVPSVIELAFSYARPQHAERYEAMFGCAMRFGAEQTQIRVCREWFDRPSQPHDAEFSAICLQYCENVLRRFEGAKPVTAELRWLFKQADAGRLPSLDEAAACLKLSGRTLRRRLGEEGTRYRDQVDAFRAEQARTLLSHGALSAKEVAYALGFREHSAFRHAFKAWTGMTVQEYRATLPTHGGVKH